MKRWHKRSVIILLLGIAGIIALGLRPSVEPPTARALTAKPYAEIPLPAHYVTGDLRITYRWQLTEPPRHTVLRGSLQKNVFDMVTPTEWEITIQAKDGKLTAEYTTPTLPAKAPTHTTNTQYHAYFGTPVQYYLPNGASALKYYLYLHCQSTLTPSFWQTPLCTSASQILCLDVAQGTADLVIQHATQENESCRIVQNGPTPHLPARFCGTEREQAVQRLLYDFANAAHNASKSHLFRIFVQQAEASVQQYTTANKPWPKCWEEAAAEATRAAKLIEPTVQELHRHHYYGSEPLKEFIFGPTFARIFGNTFELQQDANPIDVFGTGTENIIFEEIPAESFTESDENSEKN